MSGHRSRNKGKRGERELVKYLQALGFTDARRRQQSRGEDMPEVECPQSLPNLHLECKFGYEPAKIYVGTAGLSHACQQAENDANGRQWVVLWKQRNSPIWKATFNSNTYGTVTVAGDETIQSCLERLNNG